MTEKILESWIRGMSLAERKEFVGVVFFVPEDTGVENVSEITEDQFRVPCDPGAAPQLPGDECGR